MSMDDLCLLKFLTEVMHSIIAMTSTNTAVIYSVYDSWEVLIFCGLTNTRGWIAPDIGTCTSLRHSADKNRYGWSDFWRAQVIDFYRPRLCKNVGQRDCALSYMSLVILTFALVTI